MGADNFRGVYVPGVGEDIHAAAVRQAETLGVVRVASSTAQANQIAATNTAHVSPATPLLVLVNGVLMYHDGESLRMINQVERYSRAYEVTEGTYTLKYTEYKKLTAITVPARDYRRECEIRGSVFASIQEGRNLDLCILVDGQLTSRSKILTGETYSASTAASVEIPPGVQRKIELAVRASGNDGGYVWLYPSATHNTVSVRLTPIDGGES